MKDLLDFLMDYHNIQYIKEWTKGFHEGCLFMLCVWLIMWLLIRGKR